MIKCPECEAVLTPELEDEIVIIRCCNCRLAWRAPIDLADMEVSSEFQDALSDIYFG